MSTKIPLPEPQGMATVYKLLLKRESIVKPALVTFRKEMLEINKRAN